MLIITFNPSLNAYDVAVREPFIQL